jgi:hypothetical protein
MAQSRCGSVSGHRLKYLRLSFSTLRKVMAAHTVAVTASATHIRRSSHLKSTASPAGGTAGSQTGSGSLSSICKGSSPR